MLRWVLSESAFRFARLTHGRVFDSFPRQRKQKDMRHRHASASAWFLLICAALMAACVGQPPDPPARTASAIVGDPADTDVFCTAARFEAGMCDIIVEYDDHAGGFDLYLPHRVVQWGVGELTSETPPTVWERGLLPSEHGGGTDWTHRVWLYDFVQIWNRLCAGTTGTCGFHAEYKSASNPGQRLTFYYGRLGSGPRRFQTIQLTGFTGPGDEAH